MKNLTKVTLESIIAWKKRKLKEKREALAKDEEKKRSDYKAGRQNGVRIIANIAVQIQIFFFQLSGREMFYFNPDLAEDDGTEDGEAIMSYQRENDDDDDVQYRELQLDDMEQEAQEEDGTGTVAAADRLILSANGLSKGN